MLISFSMQNNLSNWKDECSQVLYIFCACIWSPVNARKGKNPPQTPNKTDASIGFEFNKMYALACPRVRSP